jgi:hypothetical protein
MGLFDKKKKGRDDFGSPVEEIDLDEADAVLVEDAADPDDALATAPRPSSPAYGIEDAIALMRTLPSENIELVVQVVKHTLESAHIDIAAILDDASAKRDRIESRIAVLRDSIAELERDIGSRRDEIVRLGEENREVARVVERLALAGKLGARPDTDDDSAPAAAEPVLAPSGDAAVPAPLLAGSRPPVSDKK